MSAYAIFIRTKTLDVDELHIYRDNVGPTLAGHTHKLLAAYGPFEDLEGPTTEGAVILEFPTMADAKAWYDSPAYREVREHRIAGAIYHVVLVEGL